MTEMQTLTEPSDVFKRVARFSENLSFQDLPAIVPETAALYILDLIGVAAAASKLDASRIARNHAVRHWAAGPDAPSARLLFDGRKTSLPGFGFAAATQIDNLDAHDGWQASKGHAGAALLPALLAFAQDLPTLSGQEALLNMIIGYELSYRAAVALHDTVSDYHTSGAWNSLGCAAIGSRLRGLNEEQFRHALGIAEYHGPRSQMMREIANPSMLHDGTGFGAPVGIYAVLMAEDGFWGAPAATVEFNDAAHAWSGLSERWLTIEQYIKPYPICRWAHAPIDAAFKLKREYEIEPSTIQRIDIHTFTHSAELNCDVPTSSPQAQYSLAWPVAAVMVRGCVGVNEVLEESFSDSELIEMTGRISAHVDDEIDRTFPEKRIARVEITLNDGRVLDSGLASASGGPDPQPTQQEVVTKFRDYAGTVLSPQEVEKIIDCCLDLVSPGSDFKNLVRLLTEPAAS